MRKYEFYLIIYIIMTLYSESVQPASVTVQEERITRAPDSQEYFDPFRSMQDYDAAIEAGRFRRARALAARAVHDAQISRDYINLGRTYLAELSFPLQQRLAFTGETGTVAPSLSEELDAIAGHAAERLDTVLTLMKHASSWEEHQVLVGAASELTVFLLTTHTTQDAHTFVPSRVDQDWSRVDHARNIRYGIDFIDTRHRDNTLIPVQVKTHKAYQKYADGILVVSAANLTEGTGRTLRDLQYALLRTISSDPNAQSATPRDYTSEERALIFTQDASLIDAATTKLFAQLDAYPALPGRA